MSETISAWTPARPYAPGDLVEVKMPRSWLEIWRDRIVSLRWNVPRFKSVWYRAGSAATFQTNDLYGILFGDDDEAAAK